MKKGTTTHIPKGANLSTAKVSNLTLNIGWNLWNSLGDQFPEGVPPDEFVKLMNELVDFSVLQSLEDYRGSILANKQLISKLARNKFGTHWEIVELAEDLLDGGFDSVEKDGYRVTNIAEEGLFFEVKERGTWKNICGMSLDEFRDVQNLPTNLSSGGYVESIDIDIPNNPQIQIPKGGTGTTWTQGGRSSTNFTKVSGNTYRLEYELSAK